MNCQMKITHYLQIIIQFFLLYRMNKWITLRHYNHYMDFFLAKINCCEKKTENSIMFCYCVKNNLTPFFCIIFLFVCVRTNICIWHWEKKRWINRQFVFWKQKIYMSILNEDCVSEIYILEWMKFIE